MIEPQPSGRAKLLATAGTAGAAVNAGRHDDSMPGVRISNRWIDQQDSTVTRSKSNSRFYQELWGLRPVEARDGARLYRGTSPYHHI